MQRLLSTEGKVYSVMMTFYQLIVLNLLFLISCLPIVTIGAALTALFSVTLKLTEHEEENLVRLYWKRFKSDFGQSTKIWLGYVGLFLVIGLTQAVWLPFVRSNQLVFVVLMLFAAIGSLASLYVFPLLAKFDNSCLGILKNALLLGLKHLPYSMLMFFLIVLMLAVPIFLPKVLFVWLFVGAALTAYLCSMILKGIFSQYTM